MADWIPIGLIAGVRSSTQTEAISIGGGVSRKAFRTLVGVSAFLFIAILVSITMEATAGPSTQPGPDPSNTNSSLFTLVEPYVAVAWGIIYFVSTVGLLLFKKWGRLLFALAMVIFLIDSLFTASDSSMPVGDWLTGLILFTWGGIMALAYLTPLFETHKPATVTAK